MSNYNNVKGIEVFSSANLQKEDAAKRRSVEAKDSEAFKEMLKRKDKENKTEEKKQASSIQADLQMKAAMEGMPTPTIQPGALITDPLTISKTAALEGNHHTLNELIGLLVQKITTVTSEQHKEIRLILQDHILQGTEVRITAENQHLTVQFLTASGSINQWLAQRKSALQTNLAAELSKKLDRQHDIVVSITSNEEKQAERQYP